MGCRSLYVWPELYKVCVPVVFCIYNRLKHIPTAFLQAALQKYGSRENLQVSILKRCFRNRLTVDEEFEKAIRTLRCRRYDKWLRAHPGLAEALIHYMPRDYDFGLSVPTHSLHSVTQDYYAGMCLNE